MCIVSNNVASVVSITDNCFWFIAKEFASSYFVPGACAYILAHSLPPFLSRMRTPRIGLHSGSPLALWRRISDMGVLSILCTAILWIHTDPHFPTSSNQHHQQGVASMYVCVYVCMYV